jgi:hypothetical protein
MEAVRTSETSVDNHFTQQYIPEDNSEHHTRRRENVKCHITLSRLHCIKTFNNKLLATTHTYHTLHQSYYTQMRLLLT